MAWEYDAALIKTIHEKMDLAFKNKDAYQEKTGKYSLGLSRILTDVPETKDLLTPEIMNALCDYYGTYADVGGVTGWRNYPPDENAPPNLYASKWHADRRMPIMMKLFYLVHDTTDQDGPFHIMDRETTKRIVRTEYKDRNNPGEQSEKDENFFRLTGKAGSILIGNTTYCMHKAGIPAEGHYRDIIQFCFFPSKAPLPKQWYKDTNRSKIDLENLGR